VDEYLRHGDDPKVTELSHSDDGKYEVRILRGIVSNLLEHMVSEEAGEAA